MHGSSHTLGIKGCVCCCCWWFISQKAFIKRDFWFLTELSYLTTLHEPEVWVITTVFGDFVSDCKVLQDNFKINTNVQTLLLRTAREVDLAHSYKVLNTIALGYFWNHLSTLLHQFQLEKNGGARQGGDSEYGFTREPVSLAVPSISLFIPKQNWLQGNDLSRREPASVVCDLFLYIVLSFIFLFSFWYFLYINWCFQRLLVYFVEHPGTRLLMAPAGSLPHWIHGLVDPNMPTHKGHRADPFSTCANFETPEETPMSDACLSLHFHDPIYIQYVFLQHQTELIVQINVLSTLPARINQSTEKAGCRQCCPGHSATVV